MHLEKEEPTVKEEVVNPQDYDFEIGERTYHVIHDRDYRVAICDEEYEEIVGAFNFGKLWSIETGLPKDMARLLITGYLAGKNDGIKLGTWEAQRKMRAALGL